MFSHCGLLGYDILHSGRWVPMFRNNSLFLRYRCFPETVVPTDETTRCHITADHNNSLCRFEDLTPYTIQKYMSILIYGTLKIFTIIMCKTALFEP
jgi:hypothetical protein